MRKAIVQIQQLIQYHENERDKSIAFFESSEFIGESEFVIEQTKRIYSDLIDELNEAIRIIKEYQQVMEFSNQ